MFWTMCQIWWPCGKHNACGMPTSNSMNCNSYTNIWNWIIVLLHTYMCTCSIAIPKLRAPHVRCNIKFMICMLFYSCRMFVVVKAFGWHALQCFCHFIPCIPIPQMLPLPLIIGRLKNEVGGEKTHRNNFLHMAHDVRRGGPV